MSRKLVRNLLSSGMQAVALQVLGTGFFYLISLRLSKDDFGLISWANAFTALLTTILSMGLEQVVVRRIAVSKGSSWPAAAFFFHALTGSLLTLVVLFIFWTSGYQDQSFTLFLFFGVQGLIYLTSPLRQYLNATEHFTPYGIIAIVSNSAKLGAAIIVSSASTLSVFNVAIILICCSVFEWLCLVVYLLTRTSFSFQFRLKAYFKLVREALPQYFSVLFDTGLSRMDWILLGILSTKAVTADYSFAYRGFEMARLPLLAIGPVIMPRFARMLAGGKIPDELRQDELKQFHVMESFFAISLLLVLNIIWQPAILFVTHGKYGSSNADIFFILTLCLPLHFMINLFWTLCFNAGKYRQISVITVITSLLNLLLNLLLIPIWQGQGAAIAFLTATLIQAVLYYTLTRKILFLFPVLPVLMFGIAAAGAFFAARFITDSWMVRLFIAIIIYVMVALFSRQIKLSHYHMIRKLFRP